VTVVQKPHKNETNLEMTITLIAMLIMGLTAILSTKAFALPF
jgi:hypothetical protein